jgi:hypothetical protein
MMAKDNAEGIAPAAACVPVPVPCPWRAGDRFVARDYVLLTREQESSSPSKTGG